MLEALRIKIKSHAAEARLIRVSEQRSLGAATALRIRSRLIGAGIPDRSIARIMKRATARGVGIPRLTKGKPADALLFSPNFDYGKLPEYVAAHDRQYRALRAHRVCEPTLTGAFDNTRTSREWPNGKPVKRDNSLRFETRHALLAYGFLRGRDFKRMEEKSYVRPDFAHIESIARRFADGGGPIADQLFAQRFADWGDGGPIADQLFAQRFAEWKSAAGAWVHPNATATPVAADHE